jgi:DNA-binding Lrp family transcriptional regulator
MTEGWVSLHRKFIEWEWYDDINTKVLFIHCLIKANWKDKQWRGNTIKRGSFITSLNNLSNETGLSLQNVRTSLSKLQSTGEINKVTTSVNTTIIISNYNDYQDANKEVTNDQQTTNKRLTTTNKDNNYNKDNKSILDTSDEDVIPTVTDLETWNTSQSIAEYLLESICRWDDTHKYNRRKPSLNGWVKEIDKAIRLDGRTEEQLMFIIDFIFKEKNDVSLFWSANIQSGKKLRDKFDQIKNQIKREKNKLQNSNKNSNGNYKTKGDLAVEFLSR